MPTTEFDPSDEGVSTEQKTAEASALAQGEKIAEMEQADKQAAWDNNQANQEDPALIGGKFKSQDDLLKAYEELQRKMGKPTEEGEEASEPEAADETPTEEIEEVGETVSYMEELGKEWDETGALSPEAIEKLSSSSPEELIQSYIKYQQRIDKSNAAQQIQAAEVQDIQNSVGGADAYQEMINWAVDNLTDREIQDFNQITTGTNPVAARFAVDSLKNRWKSTEGYEAPLVSGKGTASGIKPYRSQAELARDIANPLYQSDPAFREDVETRLIKSKDLL